MTPSRPARPARPARHRPPRALRRTAAAAVLAAASAGLLAAGPALAGGPPGNSGPGGTSGNAGCAGQSCYADVWQWVRLSGSYGAGGPAAGQPQVPVPPPPCYMEPLFSGQEMYELWKLAARGEYGSGKYDGYIAAIKAHRNGGDGYWYTQIDNMPADGSCGLPVLAWVPTGAAPPLPRVPPVDLADYAYDHMRLPPPALTVNPAARSYVSLPTYVWAGLGGATTRTVTATLGAESASVTALAGRLYLSLAIAGTAYSPCPPTGSRSPVGHPPADSGPGTKPDCGVVFAAASPATTIGARLSWAVTSNYGGFPPIPVTGAKTVSVAEIQGLNG